MRDTDDELGPGEAFAWWMVLAACLLSLFVWAAVELTAQARQAGAHWRGFMGEQ